MTKYKLVCLGNGSALDTFTFDTNFILRCNPDTKEERILAIDVGRTWPEAMKHHGYDWKLVDAIFVTHLHADHVGGLEWLGFSKYFKQGGYLEKYDPRGYACDFRVPRLIGSYEVIEKLWEQTLRGGMESLQGRNNKLSSYFQPVSQNANGCFMWANLLFSIVPTVHVVDTHQIKSSSGITFESNGKKIFFTGDTQFKPYILQEVFNDADIIFHDCEMANYPQSVHAQYHELCTLPKEIRKKMHLMHHNSDVFEVPENFEAMGFAGFVKEGQVFEF